MPYFVVVYVGFEGIDHLIHVTQSAGEAGLKMAELRALAVENAKLDEETRFQGPYPQCWWDEPDRFCVMTQELGEKVLTCCCAALGIKTEKLIYY